MSGYVDEQTIRREYAPYDVMPGFAKGWQDYLASRMGEYDGVFGQAYDRGAEAAMRVKRAEGWINQNVGRD